MTAFFVDSRESAPVIDRAYGKIKKFLRSLKASLLKAEP
jgi:hypothetical protein